MHRTFEDLYLDERALNYYTTEGIRRIIQRNLHNYFVQGSAEFAQTSLSVGYTGTGIHSCNTSAIQDAACNLSVQMNPVASTSIISDCLHDGENRRWLNMWSFSKFTLTLSQCITITLEAKKK